MIEIEGEGQCGDWQTIGVPGEFRTAQRMAAPHRELR
jgi:hypothetical protein